MNDKRPTYRQAPSQRGAHRADGGAAFARASKRDASRNPLRTRTTTHRHVDGASERAGSYGSGRSRVVVQHEPVSNEPRRPRRGPQKTPRPHRQNPIARLVNRWFDRVMGAVKEGDLAGQSEEYAAHRTTRDFVWNSAGAASWGMVFPILTMVSSQLVGVEQAGMFSMAFMVGTLLMFLANFGVRTYQVSDVERVHSFNDYQINRIITCILMIVVGLTYCVIRGYQPEMFMICVGVFLYRMVDGLADVYEGRLQQVDKLYLAGISQTIRSVLAIVVFSVVLFISHSIVAAGFGMAIVAMLSFLVVTYPLALLETPKSRKASLASIKELFRSTAPLFIGIFMFNLIDSMPKFAMEGMLSYDNQLYFNALYFPAQTILIVAQLVYRPLLVRMAGVWQDPAKRRQFDLILVGILFVVVAITAVVFIFMAWVGVQLLSFFYGVDFEPMRGLLYLMLVAGGVTAAIDFLYQVITVMRRQRDVTTLYLVTFGFSLFIPTLLVAFTGLPGAVLSYLIIMVILFVLLVWEYFRIRSDLARIDRENRRAAALSHVPSLDEDGTAMPDETPEVPSKGLGSHAR